MMERFKKMSADEQKQFIARMKERGRDTSAFETPAKGRGAKTPAPSADASLLRPKYGAASSAQTIDALVAPLPVVETRGRVWLFMNHELKPVNLRLGISDGTNTELLSGELQPNMEVVTGVTGLGATRTVPGQTGTGNPLLPSRGGPGGRGR
jgi:multidrug efflux pump subunit AcrA (membrane-fusion protein)